MNNQCRVYSTVVAVIRYPLKKDHTILMQDFVNIDTAALLEMLVKYTVEYTKMIAEGKRGDEYHNCKETITIIQLELERRHSKDC